MSYIAFQNEERDQFLNCRVPSPSGVLQLHSKLTSNCPETLTFPAIASMPNITTSATNFTDFTTSVNDLDLEGNVDGNGQSKLSNTSELEGNDVRFHLQDSTSSVEGQTKERNQSKSSEMDQNGCIAIHGKFSVDIGRDDLNSTNETPSAEYYPMLFTIDADYSNSKQEMV